ncbi:MAG TPA: ribonuclease HII [Candidatus Baltobacteraceae bacterium]
MNAADRERRVRNAYRRERRRLQRLHLFENAARARGFLFIGGVDEVGRGPLAGPVVAACVVTAEPLMLDGLNDSKKVTPAHRVELAAQIRARVVSWAIGEASVEEIDRINIYWASVLAMERALAALPAPPEYLITDAVRIKSFVPPQEPLIKGDERCAVVAAASILAKVHRDALLLELDRQDPRYGFGEHKGYATPQHLAALAEFGPCAHHRAAFNPVRLAQLDFRFDDTAQYR